MLAGCGYTSDPAFLFPFCRYQEEQRAQEEAERRAEKERRKRSREEKIEEESALRDKLIKNVQQLEQRKLEVQRELLLRSLTSEGGPSHLKSAVVIPNN